MRCFTKKIADGIAIAGEGETAPQINFQCKEGSKGVQRGCCGGCFQNASLDSSSAQPGT